MANILTLFINDNAVFNCDRNDDIDEQKSHFLDTMDADMDKGIKIKGELITTPDADKKARFVVLNLIKSIQQENQATISASSAYLCNRYPNLLEVRVTDGDNEIIIEFVDETVE